VVTSFSVFVKNHMTNWRNKCHFQWSYCLYVQHDYITRSGIFNLIKLSSNC